MKKSFKTNEEYFSFFTKNKNKIDVFDVKVTPSKIVLFYERIDKDKKQNDVGRLKK